MITSIRLFLLVPIILLLANCADTSGSGSQQGASCGIVIDINQNDSLDGDLQRGDCTGNNISLGQDVTALFDQFRVSVDSQSTLTITLRSTDFDTILYLLDVSTSCTNGCSDSTLLAFDDDGGGGIDGTDSEISFNLNTGTYLILVTAFGSGSGNFNLETSI
ncbi:MAG: hypothetical protein ACI822_003019 [Gammaproteobacteria bacterium]|jgi:hypothetical protein